MRTLKSRKLWIAIATIAAGIIIALGADADQVERIAGSATALLAAVSYIFAQGRVDAASASNMLYDGEAFLKLVRAVVEEENKKGAK